MSQHLSVPGRVETEGKIAPAAARRVPAMRDSTLSKDGHEVLVRTVKQDVIPRLVALPWARVSTQLDESPQIGDATVRRLTALCLESDAQAVAVFVAQLHRAGVSAAAIFESLLTPVARQLGHLWEDDACSFIDVTIGVLRLQNAQRTLTEEYRSSQAAVVGAPSAVLMPVPGEQHSFGLSVVADYFLRAGWNARLQPVPTDADAIRLIRRESFDMIGLSFACDERIGAAETLIAAIRKASANRGILVLVGGPSFLADPSLAARIGADATALDGPQAVLRANDLLHPPSGAA